MPLKPSYLMLIGGGAIVAYSGLKGKGIGSAFRNVIAGQAPSGATPANLITGSNGSGGSNILGNSISGTTLSRFGANVQGNVSPRQVYKAFRANGIPWHAAMLLTAITGVESGYSTRAFNGNAATGDRSVGLTQINYFGPLLQERTQLIGMGPQQLLDSGLAGQARATAILYRTSGLGPWMPDITLGRINAQYGNTGMSLLQEAESVATQ
jgi:hypothetical protein